MRTYTDVTVLRAIVHNVLPRSTGLRISALELELDADVANFLVAHVEGGVHDAEARAARFVVHEPDRASANCQRILDKPDELIPRSARLASLLYDVSSVDKRIADGTLAVAYCRSTSEPFLALLKLEPSDAFRAIEDTTPSGTRIQLKVEHDILPSGRQRLQKAAFIRATVGPSLQMLMVDRQRPGTEVSQFFAHDFLGAEPTFDARERTRRLYAALKNAENIVRPRMTPDQIRQLGQYIDGNVVAGHVNVDALVTGLPVTEPDRAVFSNQINAELPDRDFDLDPETVKGYLRRRIFSGDNGLRVSLHSEYVPDMITQQPPATEGDNWTITIRTKSWKVAG